jgi:hypothetical protein
MQVFMTVLALWMGLFVQGHAAATTEGEDLQETCLKTAGEFYKAKFESVFEKGTTTFRSHYNKRLSSCFVSISVHGYRKNDVLIDSIYTVLYDLDAKRELGSLFQVYGDREEADPYCNTVGKPVSKCSPADWDAFVLKYMKE